jgi:hypothetical protein
LSWPVAAIWIAAIIATGFSMWALFRGAAMTDTSWLGDSGTSDALENMASAQRRMVDELERIRGELGQLREQVGDLQRVLKQVE